MYESDKLFDGWRRLAQLGTELGPEAFQLWADAWQFFGESGKARFREERRRRLRRAAVLMAAAAFEGWTNFLADKVVHDGQVAGRRLSEAEVDALREKRKVLCNGKIEEAKARYGSMDRFLLLFRVLTDQGLNNGLRSKLKSSFESRDQLVHPKPGKSFDVLQSGRGADAFINFLGADVALAEAWVKAKSGKARPILVSH
jgi:hypothetical protein